MRITVGEVSELGIDSNRVCDFFRKHWKRGIALSEPSFYQWQFTESPTDTGIDHCMVAVDADTHEIHGTAGVTRRPFFLNGSALKGGELTTWIVDSEHLGHGFGARILKEYEKRYDVLFGMGLSDMAIPVIMRRGFRYIKAIPRYVRVFDFNRVQDYAECTPLGRKLIKQWSDTAQHDFAVEPLNREKAAAIEALMQKHFNFFTRDYDHLQWRYADHPVFNYTQNLIYAADKQRGLGCIVCMRLENSVENLNILHVMDFFGDPADMQAAISFINDFSLKNNVHLADFYCTSTGIGRFFLSSGWFSINDDMCFQFPHLFHPIELRKPPTTSVIYWSKKDFVHLSDIGRLYITKEDVDLDRPTAQTYHHLAKHSSER
jgi:GNAT superfamily N-acetyltransferase